MAYRCNYSALEQTLRPAALMQYTEEEDIHYVMYWYYAAAKSVADLKARRMGMITTKSIVQDPF